MKSSSNNGWVMLVVLLIIVVGLILIFAVPNLSTYRSYNYERGGMGGLRTIVSAQITWRQADIDGNGIRDYWTYDVSGFYRMYRADGATLVKAIDISLARADANPHLDGFFGDNITQNWSGVTATFKSGYWYQAMLYDEDGEPYNQGEFNSIKATNKTKFAFVAYPYPAIYERCGARILIVNEDGDIYAKDTEGRVILQWPAKDPITVGWEIFE